MMGRDAWSLDDLHAELRRFEAELRAQGLREHTVGTYVGRAETFLRWLGGTYEPRGPNVQREPRPDARGQQLLTELRDRASREDLAMVLRDYAAITGYDRTLTSLRAATRGTVDLTRADHRDALLVWLRSWGCRHLRRADNDRTSTALAGWWLEHAGNLPQATIGLTSLEPAERDQAGRAYSSLARMSAARRQVRDHEVDVVFGETAAAKTLFALRPEAFPPWDEPIRASFGWSSSADQPRYREFLEVSAGALAGLGRRLEVEVSEIPALLGRPTSTAAKLLDEYLWIRVSRGL